MITVNEAYDAVFFGETLRDTTDGQTGRAMSISYDGETTIVTIVSDDFRRHCDTLDLELVD